MIRPRFADSLRKTKQGQPVTDTRRFLFLQGPHGPWFRQLAAMLRQAGAGVWRVGFNLGDRMFWPGPGYIGFAHRTGADCVAVDNSVSPEWAAANIQIDGCVQGNLAPEHMVTGGQALIAATRHVVKAFSKGPHIFNLGHGITPDANPDHVQLMIDTVRGG